jgi:hypothetical protein
VKLGSKEIAMVKEKKKVQYRLHLLHSQRNSISDF